MEENYDVKLEFNVYELLLMLSKYYSKQLGREIKVQESHNLEYNYFRNEYYEERKPFVNVKIYYIEQLMINGINATIETIVNDYNIRLALKDFLKGTDYELDNFQFKSEIEKNWNCEIFGAIFTGMTVYLKVKGLQKRKLLGERQ